MNCHLDIKNLYAEVEGKMILNGIDFKAKRGEIHAIMGPNGSGKSSLAFSILGHPDYKIKKGEIFFNGRKINGLKTEERSKLGIFLSFQEPVAVEGVSLLAMIKAAEESQNKKYADRSRNRNVFALRDILSKYLAAAGLSQEFIMRPVNQNFSGGEKKKLELAQLRFFKPKLAILDEIEAGLDAESLNAAGRIINQLRKEAAVILITHGGRIFDAVKPDKIHVMRRGRFCASGPASLAYHVEKRGYANLAA
jgi:Fe-S cluster assembly ATP-binding protein